MKLGFWRKKKKDYDVWWFVLLLTTSRTCWLKVEFYCPPSAADDHVMCLSVQEQLVKDCCYFCI